MFRRLAAKLESATSAHVRSNDIPLRVRALTNAVVLGRPEKTLVICAGTLGI